MAGETMMDFRRCKASLMAALAGGLLIASVAQANDTTAVLSSGGLVFTRSDTIRMVSEDLFISPSKVKVDYIYRNDGEKPYSTIVAFPMPRIGGDIHSITDVPDVESDNFMGFSVLQDGKPIETNLQQRALLKGLDFTAALEAQGVPLQPYAEATIAALKRVPAVILAEWEVKGLIVISAYAEQGTPSPEYFPAWELDTVYWWETTFPVGKDVSVTHTYRPSVGGTVAMVFIQDGQPSDAYADYKERYCIDDAFMKLAARLEKDQNYETGQFYYERWLSYILTTGANWAGPIENFKLTIDKEHEKNYVSFCGEGVRKTGPTTFEMTATDFYPQKDLDILLVVPSNY